ncbi:MAG: hypothetical protein WC308_01155 [archaeon]
MIQEKNAQGTIEYLIVLAIIVVIGLIVVTLLLQFTDAGRGLRQNDSEIKWRSATPFAIVNHVQSDRNLTVVLKNNTASSINFVKLCVGGNNVDCNSEARLNVAPNATINVIVRDLNYTAACTGGASYSFAKAGIFIDYNNSDIASHTQPGAADLIGTCT